LIHRRGEGCQSFPPYKIYWKISTKVASIIGKCFQFVGRGGGEGEEQSINYYACVHYYVVSERGLVRYAGLEGMQSKQVTSFYIMISPTCVKLLTVSV
jgi:hypothetical protein